MCKTILPLRQFLFSISGVRSCNKFTVQNFRDLLPLIKKASVLAFGNRLDFLQGFVFNHLQHVYENADMSDFDNNLFPHLLHAAIRLSFAQKQRDRANREKNEANREKNEAVRDRDAAVQEKESMLRDIRAASYYIGKYD